MQSNSNECVPRHNIEILNLFDPELQLNNTMKSEILSLKTIINELGFVKQTVIIQ